MSEKEPEKTEVIEEKQKPVDEKSGIYFSSSIKIFDPNTKEVIVQLRGDN